MTSLIVAIVFIVGLVISVFSIMVSIKKRSVVWNIFTVLYGVVVNKINAVVSNIDFDYIATIVFVASLVLLGWLIVKFEVIKEGGGKF